jgi:hypothetical protein
MSKYFDAEVLQEMNEARIRIFAEREIIYRKYKIDILDTDALSALSIYQIVKQYDSSYNVNFSRNGEDAKNRKGSVEQKAARVEGPLTKTGKLRKGAGQDAAFQFHAMGDIEHPQYIFTARNKDNLALVRIYDIGSVENCKIVNDHLQNEKEKYLKTGHKKRDIIMITEKFIQENIKFTKNLTIDGCNILKD